MTATPVLDLLDFARLLLDAIEASEAEYMLGGALAVMAYAEARSTQDIDVVVNLPVEAVGRFSNELEARQVLVPVDIILDHLLETRADLSLSAVHLQSGHRADIFLMRPGDHLREAALGRRRLIDLGEPLGEVHVHSPEDLILYKLRYFAISEQDKHVRDIAAILSAMGDHLEQDYLAAWVGKLGLHNSWKKVLKEARRRAGFG